MFMHGFSASLTGFPWDLAYMYSDRLRWYRSSRKSVNVVNTVCYEQACARIFPLICCNHPSGCAFGVYLRAAMPSISKRTPSGSLAT